MDLEELNKSQIVLLTMLVSFVTSIATGIVTASLVEKAPSDVTRVIQRVVERTVETVSPETQQATVITKEKTIIVKEADLIAAAIASNKTKIVSVIDAKTKEFVSLGVFINDKGLLATDASVIDAKGAYALDLGGDTPVPVSIAYDGGDGGIVVLKADGDVSGVKKISPALTTPELGQTLVAFVGGGSITQGITTEISKDGFIGTSINAPKMTHGAPLINVDGDVVGLYTGASSKMGKSVFEPLRAGALLKAINKKDTATSTNATSTKAETNKTATKAKK